MVALLFILIAYAIRKRYLPEDAGGWERLTYYSVCVIATPLFGPKVYKWLMSPNNEDRGGGKRKKYGYIFPDF